jgi:hypothetical protein
VIGRIPLRVGSVPSLYETSLLIFREDCLESLTLSLRDRHMGQMLDMGRS